MLDLSPFAVCTFDSPLVTSITATGMSDVVEKCAKSEGT